MRYDGRYDGPWGLPDFDVDDQPVDDEPCGTCGGTGEKPCSDCNGTGVNRGGEDCQACAALSLPCPDCRAYGSVAELERNAPPVKGR